MKKILYLLSSVFLCIMINNSCVHDESTYRQNSNCFFNPYGVTDKNVMHFMSQLSLKNDSADFVTPFVKEYGRPLWKESFSFPIEDRWVYAIPIKRDGQIGSIWFFDRDGQEIKYFMFSRKNATGILEECFWMFDYFDVKLSLYKPKRKGECMVFIEKPVVDTRMLIITEYCNDIYTGTEGNLEYRYTYCWSTYDYVYFWRFDSNDNSGGGGTLPGGGGSSGGSGGGLSSNASKIVVKEQLDPNGEKELNQILEEMLKQCGYRTIYNFLTNNSKGFSNIFYDGNITMGQYYYLTGGLGFKNNGTIYQGFPEEFLHLFQNNYYEGGLGSYLSVGRVNIEFEAKLTQDILCVINGTYCGYFGTGKNYSDQYIAWVLEVTKNGTYIPQYSDLIDTKFGGLNYWDFLKDFQADPNRPNYNYPIDSSLEPQMLNFLNKSACNSNF